MTGRVTPAQIRANRLDLLSRLVDGLAHEIRNPVNSMAVNLELVKRKAASDPEAAVQRAIIVEEAARQVHELVEALLRALRPPASRSDACSVAAVLGGLFPLLQARARLARVELEMRAGEAGLAAISADDLTQVVLNLADNAMDAVSRGGRVRLKAEETPRGVILVVEDSGPGMASTGDSFTAGSTTRAGREGLGLAVVRQLVEEAGGTIGLGDTPSDLGGAAFRVLLARPCAA